MISLSMTDIKIHTTISESVNCLKHATAHKVALVALGNSLRGDDAIGAHLLAAIPAELSAKLCMFNAESCTRDVPEFLHGHKLGIIVDAAGSNSDELIVVDLSDINQQDKIAIDCSHALSWLDEIVLFRESFVLPQRLLFVGVPAYDTQWRQGLSTTLHAKLPQLNKQLCELIAREMAAMSTEG